MDKKKKQGVIGLILLVVLMILLAKSLANRKEDVPTPSGEPLYELNAKICSEKRVNAELNVSELKLHKVEAWQDLTETGNGEWIVTGPVTATNSVGGQTETKFTCRVNFTNPEATACNTKCVYLDPLTQ